MNYLTGVFHSTGDVCIYRNLCSVRVLRCASVLYGASVIRCLEIVEYWYRRSPKLPRVACVGLLFGDSSRCTSATVIHVIGLCWCPGGHRDSC